MGKKDYVVESDFDDLHGNADDAPDLELDLSDSDNPIIKAALSDDDENWKPPEDDDENDESDEASEEDEDEDVDADEDDDEDSDQDSDEDEDEDEDEDSEDEGDDDEDEDEDADEKYSKKVQKRIERERAARRRDNEESSRRIAKLEKKAALRDARDEFATVEREANTKLRALKKQKVAALDEGTTTEVVDIDEEILDIKADIKAKQIALKQQEADIDTDDDTPDSSGTPAEGRRFLKRYPEFHSNKRFRDVLLLTDKAVAARDFDRNTKEYYEEIENILRPQFPDIIKKAVKVTTKRKKKKRSAVGSTTKPGTRKRKVTRRNRRGVVRLTKADQQQMQIFGMDPTNPADAKAWAAEKGK